MMVTASLVTDDGKPHPHRLEGPSCKQGVFVYQAGQKDPLIVLKHKAIEEEMEYRQGQYRSDEQIRKNQRKITRGHLKSIGTLLENMGQEQRVKLPPLKIKPTIKENQRTAPWEREQFSRKISPPEWADSLHPPFGDPLTEGFAHRDDEIDLSSVRLAFFVKVVCESWVSDYLYSNGFRLPVSDVIFDSTPRWLKKSLCIIYNFVNIRIMTGSWSLLEMKVHLREARCCHCRYAIHINIDQNDM